MLAKQYEQVKARGQGYGGLKVTISLGIVELISFPGTVLELKGYLKTAVKL